MKMLFDYKSPIIVLLCFLAVAANTFACQYWLNPARTIFLGLPLTLLLFYYTLSPFLSLFGKHYSIKKRFGIILATLLAWLIGVTVALSMPNGVAVRLSQFSEQDFQEVSSLVDVAYEKHRGDSAELGHDEEYRSFLEELKESHDIFNLSSFPVRVGVGEDGEDYTTIGWFGGLVGGYDVVIFEKANPPRWLQEYRAVFLYETVAYYDIENYE